MATAVHTPSAAEPPAPDAPVVGPPPIIEVGSDGTAAATGRRLGCQVRLTAVGDGPAVRRAVLAGWALVEDREARWSRFLADSEVSALNAHAGRPVPVSAPTRDLVRAAIDAWHRTDGLVDALVLDDLVALGYDRSFERLAAAPRLATSPASVLPTSLAPQAPPRPAATPAHRDRRVDGHATAAPHPAPAPGRGAAHRPTVADVVVDEAAGTVTLPAGTGFDPGGVGKGRIADEVVAAVLAAGAAGACADLGGDVAVAGRPPEGDAWHVAVLGPADDDGAEPRLVVALAQGAVATSATTRRRWWHEGEAVHHLVDPATGRPAATDVVAATVVAARCGDAEVLAKAAVLVGLAEGVALIGEAGATGLVTTADGWVVRATGLDDFEVVAPSWATTTTGGG